MVILTNEELINHLKKSGVLKSKSIINAFLAIDRKRFILDEYLDQAYNDCPLPIGYGQTISQPFTVAFMLELLELKEGQRVLDVGSGSGWTTSLLAEIVGEGGKVYGIEIIPEIFEFGKKNIAKYNFLEKGRVEVFLGDGSKGLAEKAPFDRILVSAAMQKEIPPNLINQLTDNGILVIPDNDGIWKVIKEKNKVRKNYFPGFVFVKLIE